MEERKAKIVSRLLAVWMCVPEWSFSDLINAVGSLSAEAAIIVERQGEDVDIRATLLSETLALTDLQWEVRLAELLGQPY